MKTLKLTLTRYWFDMIKRGEKLEEYREIKPYWVSRLCKLNFGSYDDFDSIVTYLKTALYLNHETEGKASSYIPKYDFVQAKNGYGKLDPVITWKPGPIRIGLPRAEWCAPGTDLTKPVFIIPILKLL